MMKRFIAGVVFAGAVAVGVKKLSEYAVDEDGTRHKVYKDLCSGTSFTVLGG